MVRRGDTGEGVGGPSRGGQGGGSNRKGCVVGWVGADCIAAWTDASLRCHWCCLSGEACARECRGGFAEFVADLEGRITCLLAGLDLETATPLLLPLLLLLLQALRRRLKTHRGKYGKDLVLWYVCLDPAVDRKVVQGRMITAAEGLGLTLVSTRDAAMAHRT